MELPRERPPEYVSTNPDNLRLPSVPQHEVGSPPQHPADLTLPALSSVLAGLPDQGQTAFAYDRSSTPHALRADRLATLDNQPYTRSLPGFNSSQFGPMRMSSEFAVMSPTETGSVMSIEEHGQRSTSVVSLEDPDVRMAAEALSGLGNPEFQRTPRLSHRPQAMTSDIASTTTLDKDQEEPLLQLLIDVHPWVGGTINGSLTAYTTTKHYTPRFVQYSANLIERGMVNTVSTVGRRTGVESGLRSYLGSRRHSDVEKGEEGDRTKRRRMEDGDKMDVDGEEAVDDSSSRAAYDFLPAYKNSKPPSYREEASPADMERGNQGAVHSRSWSNRFLVSTSGLGVALSETSRTSLTYCVQFLTKANQHVQMIMNALKLVLEDYERAQEDRQREQARYEKEVEAGYAREREEKRQRQEAEDEAARRMADRIKYLCEEIWKTIQCVVDQVSTYTGAALPDNARRFVKTQLLSIPQRWRWASEQAESSKTAGDTPSKSGRRMIAFATEGLDMMGQVNGVVRVTLQSAEDWLSTFGRKRVHLGGEHDSAGGAESTTPTNGPVDGAAPTEAAAADKDLERQ